MKKTFISKIAFLLFILISGISVATNAQILEWAKTMGGSSVDKSGDVAVDKDGNTYVVGTFYGTADFNSGTGVDTINVAGESDVFLAKYDAGGNYL